MSALVESPHAASAWPHWTAAWDRRGVLALLALAALGIALRFAGLALGAGMDSRIGLDDATYFAGATSFVEGRLPYRDFNILHPPGILYSLAPFAYLARFIGETDAFVLARFAVMLLGGVNIVLVGLVGRRIGWGTALCAAALYTVWSVPAQWERSAYLIAPQATLLLLALLQLTGRNAGDLTTRRVIVAGVLMGVSGAFQVWSVIPAAVILAWIVITCRSSARIAVRRAAAYVLAGVVTVLLLLGPFLLTTGPKMIQMIIFAQASRTGIYATPVVDRLRQLEGLPPSLLGFHVPGLLVVAIGIVIGSAVLFVAWKRPAVRLWVAIGIFEMAFLMITPTFVNHYAAWPAAVNTLSIGAVVAFGLERARPRPRRVLLVIYAAALVGLAVLTARPTGSTVAISPTSPDLTDARCVVANESILLIRSETLIRSLRNGCRLLPNPRSVSHVNNAANEGPDVPRARQAEYQQGALEYYTSGDVALIRPLEVDGFSEATWAAIQAALPYHERYGKIDVLRKSAP